MKSKLHASLAAVCFLLFLNSCTSKPVDFLREPFPAEQTEIAKIVNDIFTAAGRKDIERMEQFHRYSPKFTKFDDWEPLTRQDAEGTRKAEKESFSAISDFTFKIADLKVDVFGSVAIATFHIDYGFKMGADKAAAKARATMVFVEDDGKWLLTHEHFSAFKANP